MKRALLRSSAFVRAAQAWVKKHPETAEDIRWALGSLAADAFNPLLHTHKLKGKFRGYWACSAGYDLRIMFREVY
jgi:mRNA-degrading endonuclease YafQ of YafQ-DinJ toxin-antitoxin module